MKKLLIWIYQKIADHYFYRWVRTKNEADLQCYESWIDKKHALVRPVRELPEEKP